jgi:hypothetical protein
VDNLKTPGHFFEFFFGGEGGTAKIAHHSIIGDYQDGGLKYKDLNSFVLSVNFKF